MYACSAWEMTRCYARRMRMLICQRCNSTNSNPGDGLQGLRCGWCGGGPLERYLAPRPGDRDEKVIAVGLGAFVGAAIGGLIGAVVVALVVLFLVSLRR